MTKYYKPSGLTNRHLLSLSSGGQELETQVLAGLAPLEGSEDPVWPLS